MTDILNAIKPLETSLEGDVGTILGDGEKMAAASLIAALGPIGAIIVPFLPQIPSLLETIFTHSGHAVPEALANVITAMDKAMRA